MGRKKKATASQLENLGRGIGYPPAWSDEALCRLIWDARQEFGACTLKHLSEVTGQSKQAISSRLRTLQRRGKIQWTVGVSGSIRLPNETVYLKKS